MEISYLNKSSVKAVEPTVSAQQRAVAEKMETAFIAEVLKYIQPDSQDAGFSGGIGEEQFQSFLHDQQANLIMQRGGFGLSEQFVKSLSEAMG